MTDLTPHAAALTDLLTSPRPALGAFLPAGFPNWTAGIDTLAQFAQHGADFLEVGVAHHTAALDGPDIAEAYATALGQGAAMAHVISTVRLTAANTHKPVVVMSYWQPVHVFGPQRFAEELAEAGAAGVMIPDLRGEAAAQWHTIAAAAGIHAPQFVSRRDSDAELQQTVATASGWIYAPAADARTGFQGELDIPGLHAFTSRLREHTSHPIVAGVGISTPARAAMVAPYADGLVIGSPLVRPLLQGGEGRQHALDLLTAFAQALRPAPQTWTLPA
ncbi:tryptophan synthase subunit alpha [Streptomyces anulatus]|uniref:tryptophan synthase subunit alpha n=1 Tax=Streptomyces anulatus TaxID=1892 RepID=UPI001C265A24|nr:tryptophan synthase subunit alpha [Streptomyces anulatus]